ncbi:hypothetical protein V5799_026373 [Amblyomma americanum]|uniref:Vasculin n=1 Tax=Amblyomma americanum TaxID=6943 RepID=A0AAQ4DIS0_AMBAM
MGIGVLMVSHCDKRALVSLPTLAQMSPNAVVPCGDNCANVVCAQAGPAASQHDKKDLTGNNFNQEFPTLLGADEAPVQQPAVTNGSVWENPRNSRVHGTVLRKGHLVQRPRPDPSAGTLLETRSRSPGSTTGGTGVVTPAAALSPKLGHTTGLTGSAPAASKSSVSASQNSLYRALLPSSNKTVREKGGPLAHAMEVLVKKQPRTKGGNKVDFLKALRSCKDDEEAKGAGGDTAALHDRTNGHIQVDDGQSNVDQGNDLESSACDVGKLTLEAPEHPPLSSSLEAEQRLLREMGWKEDASDDDAYAPLTEDELREFQYITKMRQEKQQQQQRNGNTQRTVTAALSDRASLWSPRRACSQVYTGLVMGNGWSSSSSSDTDSDGD